MSNNAKVGGVLSIVAGGVGVFWAVFLVLVNTLLEYSTHVNESPYDDFVSFIFFFYAVVGIIVFCISVLGIIGGIYALRRRYWGLALTGAIAGCFTFLPCGVPAVIFVAKAKPEFDANRPLGPPF